MLITQFLLAKPFKNTSNLGRGMKYTKLCFPNGLSICHQIFNKLLKPVFVALRQQDHLSSLIKMTLFLQGQFMMSVRAQCHSHYYTVWLPWVCYTPSYVSSNTIPSSSFPSVYSQHVTMRVYLAEVKAAKIKKIFLSLTRSKASTSSRRLRGLSV